MSFDLRQEPIEVRNAPYGSYPTVAAEYRGKNDQLAAAT